MIDDLKNMDLIKKVGGKYKLDSPDSKTSPRTYAGFKTID